MADTTRLVIVRLLIGAIFYGIHVIAFCICVYYTCYHKSNRRSHHWIQFVLWSMFALGTMNFISSTLFTYSALSCTHLTKGDPAKWMNDNHTDVMNTLDNASATLMFLLQDWVMLYRLHAIFILYNHKVVITVVKSLGICMVIVHVTIIVIISIRPIGTLSYGSASLPSIIHCITSVGLHAAMTVAVIIRLLYFRRSIVDVVGKEHTKVYVNIVVMFAESGAIYVVAMAVCGLPFGASLGTASIQLTGISACLIVVRVVRGRELVATVSQHFSMPISFVRESIVQDTSNQLHSTGSRDLQSRTLAVMS